jgi:hypothetical protein
VPWRSRVAYSSARYGDPDSGLQSDWDATHLPMEMHTFRFLRSQKYVY